MKATKFISKTFAADCSRFRVFPHGPRSRGAVAGLLLAGLGFPAAFAQQPAVPAAAEEAKAPEAKEGAAAPATPAGAAGARPADAGNQAAAPSTAALDYLFNRKPQDGSAAKEATDVSRRMDDKVKAADALGLSRQMDEAFRLRFEQYLGAPEVVGSTLQAYTNEAGQVSALLRLGKTFDAWKQLPRLAAYQMIDAGVSRELANRVEAIWNTGKTKQLVQGANQQLRADIKTANRNADVMSQSAKQENLEDQRKQREANRPRGKSGGAGGAGSGGAPVSGVEGKLQLTEEYLRTLEAKARIKLNELKAEKLFDQAKADFAQYISTLYGSGRYLHVVLAADFYRQLFNEGEYPVAIANQVNASLENQRDVATAVEVFRYKAGRQELAAGSERLQAAFTASAYHPAVLGLERSLKEKVASFNTSLLRMQNLIEARNFGTLESLIKQTGQLAIDFDTAKPLALVNGAKLESKLRLGKARLAAQQGNQKVALEEFQTAAELWPGNPDLQDKAAAFFDAQDGKTQSLAEFDRLFAEGNYRSIFDQQLALAPAMKDDLKRQEQLKSTLEKIKQAEMASEKASAMMLNGDAIGAWETVELAARDLPEDKKLNKLRADLTWRNAEFVSALQKAREAEGKSEWGYSLTWYVIAQRQYPASQFANSAIERLKQQILKG